MAFFSMVGMLLDNKHVISYYVTFCKKPLIQSRDGCLIPLDGLIILLYSVMSGVLS